MLTAFLLETSASIFPLGLEFLGFHRRHFHATSTKYISGKFWNFSWKIKELVGTIRKLLLLLIFIIGFKRVKRTLSRASELILANDFKKRVDSSKFLHSTLVTFARAIACLRVTCREFLSNAIRNTESFVRSDLLLLNPASARRASNGAF